MSVTNPYADLNGYSANPGPAIPAQPAITLASIFPTLKGKTGFHDDHLGYAGAVAGITSYIGTNVAQKILDAPFAQASEVTRPDGTSSLALVSDSGKGSILFDKDGYTSQLTFKPDAATVNKIINNTLYNVTNGQAGDFTKLNALLDKGLAGLDPLQRDAALKDIASNQAALGALANKEWKFEYSSTGDISKITVGGKEIKQNDPLWSVGEQLQKAILNRSAKDGLTEGYNVDTQTVQPSGQVMDVAAATPAKTIPVAKLPPRKPHAAPGLG